MKANSFFVYFLHLPMNGWTRAEPCLRYTNFILNTWMKKHVFFFYISKWLDIIHRHSKSICSWAHLYVSIKVKKKKKHWKKKHTHWRKKNTHWLKVHDIKAHPMHNIFAFFFSFLLDLLQLIMRLIIMISKYAFALFNDCFFSFLQVLISFFFFILFFYCLFRIPKK